MAVSEVLATEAQRPKLGPPASRSDPQKEMATGLTSTIRK